MREHETSAPSLGDVLDPRVDANVWKAAQILGEERLAQPEWLWFDDVRTSFGRWSRNSRQAPYVRADIAIASVTKAMAEAVASARAKGWQPIETAPKGRDAYGRVQYVLLIAAYPTNSHIWSDIRQGWHEDGEWKRWPHCFPPTHWRPSPAPPTLIPGGSSDV